MPFAPHPAAVQILAFLRINNFCCCCLQFLNLLCFSTLLISDPHINFNIFRKPVAFPECRCSDDNILTSLGQANRQSYGVGQLAGDRGSLCPNGKLCYYEITKQWDSAWRANLIANGADTSIHSLLLKSSMVKVLWPKGFLFCFGHCFSNNFSLLHPIETFYHKLHYTNFFCLKRKIFSV